MKNFFNLDNPVFQVLARLADLVVLSLVCLACCVPIVTIGPALVALYKTVYDLTLDRCSGVIKTYFRAFRSNFKQGLAAGLAGSIAIASLVCDFILLKLYYSGSSYTLLVCLVYLLSFLTLGTLAYLIPLIGRYENTMGQHIRNAFLLLVRYLPKTIAMVFLHLLPLLLFLVSPNVMVYTLPFWIFIGLGFLAQADAYLLKPVFDRLEQSGTNASESDAVPED